MNKEDLYPVINGGIEASGYIGKYNQEANTITVSQGGASAGYVKWQKTRFWAGAHCYVIEPSDKVLKRYLYYLLKSKERNLKEKQYGAGIPALSKETIGEIEVKLPTIETQAEIIKKLDNFDAIIDDLNIGIPAEINARHKQYEYYRDKLLSFERLH